MSPAGVSVVAPRITLIDLDYLGASGIIASCLLEDPSGIAVVDPGPSVTLPALLGKLCDLGLSVQDIRFILLTHIHLDHAGATGSLVRQNSRIRVFVHENGAKHMVDPSRLLRSSELLYGEDMKRLWGEFLPVPVESIQALTGGEQLGIHSRTIEVLNTPGHASHHVTYFHSQSSLAFVGDTAGVRISNQVVIPVTPPPDIDINIWNRSLDEIGKRKPERLFLTHFGLADRVNWHLKELQLKLSGWGDLVRDSLKRGDSDAECAAEFKTSAMSELRRVLPKEDVRRYEWASAPELSWYGLARYWRKREQTQLQ